MQANNSMLMKNTAMDKEKILPIAEYAQTFFGTVKQKYEDLIEFYDKEQETIQRKQNYFRIESQIMMSRIQKFVSHMLGEA